MKELEKLVESIYEEILFELKNFNFKRNSLAYEYLIEAIKLVIQNRYVIKDFKNYVYKPIGEKFHTSPKNVLWCLNKLITLMYFNTDEEVIDLYFNTYKSIKPTTKAFIIGVAREVIIKNNIKIKENC